MSKTLSERNILSWSAEVFAEFVLLLFVLSKFVRVWMKHFKEEVSIVLINEDDRSECVITFILGNGYMLVRDPPKTPPCRLLNIRQNPLAVNSCGLSLLPNAIKRFIVMKVPFKNNFNSLCAQQT